MPDLPRLSALLQPPFQAQRRALLACALAAALPTFPARAADSPGGSGHEWRPWPKAQRKLPPLDLPLLGAGPWRLTDQRGKVVVVNFWATWCEPCRAELPSLLRLAAEHAAQGLVLVAVNYRETAAKVQRFLDQQQLALPVVLDADGKAALAWTPRIFPSTVLVNRQGRPAGTAVGEVDWQGAEATAWLGPLLASR